MPKHEQFNPSSIKENKENNLSIENNVNELMKDKEIAKYVKEKSEVDYLLVAKIAGKLNAKMEGVIFRTSGDYEKIFYPEIVKALEIKSGLPLCEDLKKVLLGNNRVSDSLDDDLMEKPSQSIAGGMAAMKMWQDEQEDNERLL